MTKHISLLYFSAGSIEFRSITKSTIEQVKQSEKKVISFSQTCNSHLRWNLCTEATVRRNPFH